MRSKPCTFIATPTKQKPAVEFIGYGKYDVSFSNEYSTRRQFVHQTTQGGIETKHSLFPFQDDPYLFENKEEFTENMSRLLNEPIESFIKQRKASK